MVLVGAGAVATFVVSVVTKSISDAIADDNDDDDDDDDDDDTDDDDDDEDEDDDTATTCSLPVAGQPCNNFTEPQSYSRA